jgi:hypothetical protein
MKQKIFTLYVALIASVGTLFAWHGTCGENATWDLTDSVLTISGTGDMKNYYPDNYSSTPWNSSRSSIKSVVILDGITSIGNYAFYECSNLTSVTIPNSVISIGHDAFYGCSNLTSIEIPNSVTSIGTYAFKGCTSLLVIGYVRYADTYLVGPVDKSLSTYDIKEGTKWIGENAFNGCTNLTSMTIPNSVINIGEYAFNGCTSLTSIEIPNSIISIGQAAFSGCTSLSSIEIPNSVISIGQAAFADCTSLTSVTIPNSVTSIGIVAFGGCTGLTSVTIPNSVTSIGNRAFLSCTSLTSVTIGSGVTSIGWSAFEDCSGLTSVTIGNSVTSIGAGAFFGCTGLTSITIPNSVTSIEGGAFEYCASLTSIEIPNSVTSIGNDAFAYCSGLTSISVDSDNAIYDSRNNCNAIIESATNTLIAGCQNTVIPNSVTSIANQAFSGCTGLTSVVISKSITNIGDYAFAYCTGLESVTCMAMTPPTLGNKIWYDVDCSKISLYVPANSINTYRQRSQWDSFHPIRPISAKETETEITTVQTTATEYSVDITWPFVEGADSYELVIKDREGKIVCTLIFNAQGQLNSVAYNAPSRKGAPQQTQAAGFSYTVTGLEAGTEYDLIITTKDAYGREMDKKNVIFHTNWPNGIEDIHVNSDKPVKVLHDGHIYILRGEHVYDVQGKMVK